MFKVFYSLPTRNETLKVVSTEIDAVVFAQSIGALYLEEDKTNNGSYDGIDKHGRVICIEPYEDPTDDFNYVGSRHHY